MFYFVNNWHDHLLAAPIGFTEAAGNFQQVNHSRQGQGRRRRPAPRPTTAPTPTHGLPDGSHIDNANMATPPDGHAPTMQMYLQHQPGTTYPDGDPFSPTNVGDEADTVYHEYTHGLSNRLVVDADGRSTLGGVQAGAMGEAWSDWYAMDYLVGQGPPAATRPGTVDVVMFQYDGEGVFLDRTEPIDCTVGADGDALHGRRDRPHAAATPTPTTARSVGGPEVHADGEIWAQTLWDLRDALGSKMSRVAGDPGDGAVADNPSFLDMRNAILLADMAVYGGAHQRRDLAGLRPPRHGLLRRLARRRRHRARRRASQVPPTQLTQTGTITGTVTDSETGDPLAGRHGLPCVPGLAVRGQPDRRRPTPMATTRSARCRSATTRSCSSRAGLRQRPQPR